MHGIAYDPVRDEIIVSNPLASAVLVFRGGADGSEAPIRVIQGAKTGLVYPHSVALDVKNGEIIVGDSGRKAVLVFPSGADGDVPPARIIEGPQTGLHFVVGAAVDTVRNLLVVASSSFSAQTGLFIFNRTDDGNVTPKATISGPRTGIALYPWQLVVYEDKIFVSVLNTSYRNLYKLDKPKKEFTEIPPMTRGSDVLGFIGVWHINDEGDRPPRAIIKGPISGLVHPAGVALDVANGEIFVPDSVRNGVLTFLLPDFFGRMSTEPLYQSPEP